LPAPRRRSRVGPLGRTGERVSILGLGGYHLGTMPSLQDAIALVHEAIEAGLTLFDNAWEVTTTAGARSGWGTRLQAGATRSS